MPGNDLRYREDDDTELIPLSFMNVRGRERGRGPIRKINWRFLIARYTWDNNCRVAVIARRCVFKPRD